MYIHPTQPGTPWLHNCQQFLDTMHNKLDLHMRQHNWPLICSQYHFIAVRCVQLHCVLNGCWRICHFGCSHSFSVAWAPAPKVKWTMSMQYVARLVRKYICGCQLDNTLTLCKRQWSYIFSLMFDKHVHKNGTGPAQVCTSVLLNRTKCLCIII